VKYCYIYYLIKVKNRIKFQAIKATLKETGNQKEPIKDLSKKHEAEGDKFWLKLSEVSLAEDWKDDTDWEKAL
jgi:hypothetical protein